MIAKFLTSTVVPWSRVSEKLFLRQLSSDQSYWFVGILCLWFVSFQRTRNKRSEIQFWPNMRKKDIHITPVQGDQSGYVITLLLCQNLMILSFLQCLSHSSINVLLCILLLGHPVAYWSHICTLGIHLTLPMS